MPVRQLWTRKSFSGTPANISAICAGVMGVCVPNAGKTSVKRSP